MTYYHQNKSCLFVRKKNNFLVFSEKLLHGLCCSTRPQSFTITGISPPEIIGSFFDLWSLCNISFNPMPGKIQPIRGQGCRCIYILWYGTGNILLYFPVITCAQELCWVPFEDSSKSAPKLSNCRQRLPTVSTTSANFLMISEQFRRFLKIFRKS